MNERIRELYKQAHTVRSWDGDPMRDGNPPTVYWQGDVSAEKFAELIVRECMHLCQQEWYDLNNASDNDIEPRQIAIRVGQKSATIRCMNMIARRFGVEE